MKFQNVIEMQSNGLTYYYMINLEIKRLKAKLSKDPSMLNK